MDDLSGVVLPDGTLNRAAIVKQEEISKQKNVGRLSLTRFWMETPKGPKSYIFKPSTDKEPVEFEVWFQQNVLARLKHVRAPKLLSHRIDEHEGIFWMIYEDIGRIEPSFNKSVRVRAAEKMADWHALPAGTVPAEYKSFMPSVDDQLQQLIRERGRYENLLTKIEVPPDHIQFLFDRLTGLEGSFQSEQVVCHGDYHCLNLMDTGDDLVILDWEFIQLNSVYWDLYTLLDMATPRYRIQIDKGIRLETLRTYLDSRSATGWTPPDDFIDGYHLYSLIHSLGILGLVYGDLEAGRFDRETLLIQKREVISIIGDCLDVVLGR